MSKRQEIRERRRKEQVRNRIFIIALVIVGAVFITFALVLPGIHTAQSASATQAAANGDPIQVTPQTFTAKIDGTHMGDPNAPVKVVAYEDFRCSACLYYTQNIEPNLIKNYVETGKVYYTYAVFIVIDGNDGSDASNRAANAALCASEQNKFWEYHDILYANQVTEAPEWFTDPRLTKMAQDVGLDMTKFNQCYSAKKYASQIQQENNQALALGINATPGLVVDGKVVANMNDFLSTVQSDLAGK